VVTKLTIQERIEVLRLRKKGLAINDIARIVGRSWWGVEMALRPTPETKLWLWTPSPARLSMIDREEIRAGLARGETLTAIACALGRAISTVSREVANNGGRTAYRAVAAHRRAAECARRPKRQKLDGCQVLVSQVEEWLIEAWSPEQIARRLRHEFPDDPMMRVSHETIYKSLCVQGRGALRRELTACLRSGRVVRRPDAAHRNPPESLTEIRQLSPRHFGRLMSRYVAAPPFVTWSSESLFSLVSFPVSGAA